MRLKEQINSRFDQSILKRVVVVVVTLLFFFYYFRALSFLGTILFNTILLFIFLIVLFTLSELDYVCHFVVLCDLGL